MNPHLTIFIIAFVSTTILALRYFVGVGFEWNFKYDLTISYQNPLYYLDEKKKLFFGFFYWSNVDCSHDLSRMESKYQELKDKANE